MSTQCSRYLSYQRGYVSIPLRGRCNVNVYEALANDANKEFPSPCGEDVMSTKIDILEVDKSTVSIPLRGRCNVNVVKIILLIKELSFHPLAGKM